MTESLHAAHPPKAYTDKDSTVVALGIPFPHPVTPVFIPFHPSLPCKTGPFPPLKTLHRPWLPSLLAADFQQLLSPSLIHHFQGVDELQRTKSLGKPYNRVSKGFPTLVAD